MTAESVATHYTQGNIVQGIRDGLEKAGKSLAEVSVDDLGPVDEFHTGGRAATEHLLSSLKISSADHVLDIGCGIGGTSRFLVDRFKVKVDGVDLTPGYIHAGRILNQWVSLSDSIDLQCEDASDLRKPGSAYDLAVMLHVGMNVEDKGALFAEVHRVLKSDAVFAIYDVLLRQRGDVLYPVPWASDASMSFVDTLDVYQELLESAGFVVESVTGRGEFAKLFFRKMLEGMNSADGPPALGLHILVGPSIKEKMWNFSSAVLGGILEPTEIILRRK